MAGRDDEMGPNGLGSANPPPGSIPPQNLAQGANFYAELLQGLDPSIAATIENQVGMTSMWGVPYMQDGSVPSDGGFNLGYGGWASFGEPTFPPYTAPDGFNAAMPEITPENFMPQLSQANSHSPSGSESGYFNSFSVNRDGPSSSPDMDFSSPVQDGRQLYSEALDQWKTHPITPVSTRRPYDLFGTTDVFQDAAETIPSAPPVQPLPCPAPIPTPQVVVPPSAQQAANQAAAEPKKSVSPPVVNNKPTYSDVAKNKPPTAKTKTRARSRTNSSHSLKEEPCQRSEAGQNTLCNHHAGHVKGGYRKGKGHRPRLARTKSVPLEPTTIQPDSRYGLDTFDEPPKGCRGKDLCSRSSQSSDSLPQSRKGSTSSVGSSVSGIDDIPLLSKPVGLENLPQSSSAYNYDLKAGIGVEEIIPPASKVDIIVDEIGSGDNHETLSNKPKPAEVDPGNSTPNITTTNKRPAEKDSAFFDPKRIFAKREVKTGSLDEKNCIPNNQQSAKPAGDPMLNNGKPKASNLGSFNRSCYINNDLRDSRKQTNSKTEQSRTPSGQRYDESPTEQSPPADTAQPKAPAANQRRKADPSNDRKKKDDPAAPKAKRQKRETDQLDRSHLLGDWVLKCWEWFVWGSQELVFILWNIGKLVLSLGLLLVLLLGQYFLLAVKKTWAFSLDHIPALKRRFSNTAGDSWWNSSSGGAKTRSQSLKENITLPTTGEEAMKRLLGCKGKDPYSILGVKVDATDEEVKKYYRKQAVLVHPDKNQQPGAEEAFKILGHAFELIGDPAKRATYDSQRSESDDAEVAMQEFADLLTKLHDKMQEAANLMRCENCGGKHRRVPTERPNYAARFCDRCNIRHPTKEGDVWAESRMLGFLWHYYACMEGKVYDITEWASCQSEHFKRIQANAHHVIYRISTGGGRQRQNSSRSNEADLEDFLSHLFHHQAGAGPKGGGGAEHADGYGSFTGGAQPHATWAGPPGGAPGASNAAKKAKSRRKKARH